MYLGDGDGVVVGEEVSLYENYFLKIDNIYSTSTYFLPNLKSHQFVPCWREPLAVSAPGGEELDEGNAGLDAVLKGVRR